MKDERLGKEIGAFYRETDVTPPDSQDSARQVAARLRRTPQDKRRRWLPAWWLRTTHSPDAKQTTEHQPISIPATNGHAPTVIGRTHTMFSPVKAIFGGALVFALGGAFLIAQPFDQPGSVPGAEEGAEPAPPVEVSARYIGIGDCVDGSVEMDGYVARGHGFTCTVHNEWSDPRLQGVETYVESSGRYMDDREVSIRHYVHNIVTDDGAWRMRPQFRLDSTGPENFSGTLVLDGEGAYEGLSVVLAKDENDLDGFIVESDMLPPPPEEGSTK